ncbi:SepM family pheromone-processing serine protease [Virgibacillus sp. W0181]|uniref:SepM family pheromone-processing serine protease n=1 Tax=Virgibacillus sp. W0181 TaxID=3391581 RepID=UPI003F463D82
MKFSGKHLFFLLFVSVVIFVLATYQLPYYIYKPGHADALNEMVVVNDGYTSKGDMHLVTVSSNQATPIHYMLAKILPHQDLVPLKDARPEGISDEEYMRAQLQMMESSQEASIVVAYEAAGEKISIEYNGIFVVDVIDGMPAEGKLQMGDHITSVDGHKVSEADDLIDYVGQKKAGDIVELEINRDEEQMKVEIGLEAFDEDKEKVGVGIQLVTDRNVEVDKKIDFESGNIGGPSAGLMFSLEIYDQLTEKDLTNGLEIAGTGKVDYNGNVGRIGGIDKKVIAADREGCAIFFAPNEQGNKDSNYMTAKKTAEEIGTDMKIVPVDTFEEAVQFLEELK